MYFTPTAKSAVVVAEAMKRLDFRDPKTMALQGSLSAPKCGGINHGDFRSTAGTHHDVRIRRPPRGKSTGAPAGCSGT